MDDDAPLSCRTLGAWRQWLRRHHGRGEGQWVLLAKKGTATGIRYAEALEEALCWGWIDGKIHRHDERYFAQWFSPRRPKSVWSAANRKTVLRLSREGRMQPAGLARVADAKASGAWKKAYASAAVPGMAADVKEAVTAAGLDEAWEKLPPSHRLRYLYWIEEAKKPETRARRLAQLPALVKDRRLAGFSAS